MKRESRRMKRMSRSKRKLPGMNLTSLMDVFTILVFFLLTNSSSTEVLEPPKQITLPASVVESKPRETVVVLVTAENILVQGQWAVNTADVLNTKQAEIPEILQRLQQQRKNIIGSSTNTVAKGREVTILADKTIPFKLLKRIMSTCTRAGYEKISLAVIQKASQSQ